MIEHISSHALNANSLHNLDLFMLFFRKLASNKCIVCSVRNLASVYQQARYTGKGLGNRVKYHPYPGIVASSQQCQRREAGSMLASKHFSICMEGEDWRNDYTAALAMPGHRRATPKVEA